MNPHVANRRFLEAELTYDRAHREMCMWARMIADLAADNMSAASSLLAEYRASVVRRDAAWTALDDARRIPEQAGPRSGS